MADSVSGGTLIDRILVVDGGRLHDWREDNNEVTSNEGLPIDYAQVIKDLDS